MSSLRVAVIGTGFIGPVHVEALRRAGLEVVGILGSSEKKSRLSASALGLARAYRNFDELLNDNDIQSVHVAVPNRLHFDMVTKLVQAGKHVMCEKPLATNTADSARRYTDYPGGHNEGFPDSFKQCYRAFYDYVQVGDLTAAATFPTFADGHRELMLCEAILKSHNQQRWISVDEVQA